MLGMRDVLPNGDRLDSCGLTEGLHGAANAIGWNTKRNQSKTAQKMKDLKGVGISLCAMFSGAMYYPFASAAIVKLHDDGSATLFTGAQDIGQGSYTTLSQVLAEELGLIYKISMLLPVIQSFALLIWAVF